MLVGCCVPLFLNEQQRHKKLKQVSEETMWIILTMPACCVKMPKWQTLLVPIRMHVILPASTFISLCAVFPLLMQTRLHSVGYYELHVPPSSSFWASDIIRNVSSHKHTSPRRYVVALLFKPLGY